MQPWRVVVRRIGMQVHEHSSRTDTLQAAGANIVETVRNLVEAGNSRRVTIKRDGDTVAEFPLTFGVIGAVVAPALAAVGAIAALATDCQISVERTANTVE